jgi:hypothetical protein
MRNAYKSAGEMVMERKTTGFKRNFSANLHLARRLWPGQIDRRLISPLRILSERYEMSLANGDLQLLDGRWYVTHSGLIRLAERKGCSGIRVQAVKEFCDACSSRWIFKATVFKRPSSKGFVGYGDANPSNVSSLVHGAEMRVAETRAVNRALRKAYGIGLCSVEELGSLFPRSEPVSGKSKGPSSPNGNGSTNGQPRLRDRLCLLIRQHQLDPTLVKRYAADFCGTQELREASRELVESFIATLARQAVADRDGLICKLNSYGHREAVQS